MLEITDEDFGGVPVTSDHDDRSAGFGLSERTVRALADSAGEPSWLLAERLQALDRLARHRQPASGDPMPPPRAGSTPSTALTAATTQPGGEDHPLDPNLASRGVVFGSLADAVRSHPELVRRHLGSVVAADDHAMAAANLAAWSGGTFVFVPPGVEIEVPLQATSRGRVASIGRFDRSLVVVGEGASVHLIGGCVSPVYSADPLRCAVVEVVVGAGAKATNTTIQNWSTNVTNLSIKRAVVDAEGEMEWIDGNLGGQVTMTEPSVVLAGPKASGAVRSVTMAGAGQRQRVGARMVHLARETSSIVAASTIAGEGGRCLHRGLVTIGTGAVAVSSRARSRALLLDDGSEALAELRRDGHAVDADIDDEATSSALDERQLFYLKSRGLSPGQARALLVNGFIEPVTRRLPMEYAVEWHRLVELQMERSVG